MLSPHLDPTPNVDGTPASPRLVGWKEIAAYFEKAERTVKRWERDRNLPVYRVPGGASASVYAYPAELNKWLAASDPSVSEVDDTQAIEIPEVAIAGTSNEGSLSSWWKPKREWAATAVLLSLLMAVSAFLILGNRRIPRSETAHPVPAKSQPKSNMAAATNASDSDRAEARDYYLKGRYEWNRRTPESLNRALDSFTQSIVHDPGNARAYAGLADTYDLLEIYSTMPESDTYPRAIAAARTAVELDDSLAEAHRALAFAEFYGGWNFVKSEKEFRRAIELDPNDPVARRWYATAFAVPGRFSESLEQFDKAQKLDPASHSTLSDKGMILFEAEKRDEGIALLKEVERTDPGFFSPHFYLMLINLNLHDYPAYLEEGQKAAEIRSDPVLKDVIASARAGYARSGERGLLSGLYEKQRRYYSKGKLHGSMLAITCVMMGKKQEALRLLEVAYDRHEMDAIWCLAYPDLLTLKDEPGYKNLVKRINFPAHSLDASPTASAEREKPPL
jgi:tetratricopeptide (TPR) repeat protein